MHPCTHPHAYAHMRCAPMPALRALRVRCALRVCASPRRIRVCAYTGAEIENFAPRVRVCAGAYDVELHFSCCPKKLPRCHFRLFFCPLRQCFFVPCCLPRAHYAHTVGPGCFFDPRQIVFSKNRLTWCAPIGYIGGARQDATQPVRFRRASHSQCDARHATNTCTASTGVSAYRSLAGNESDARRR